MGYFKEKVAIVTGGASGIGCALCDALEEKGAIVIAADINAGGVEKDLSSDGETPGARRIAHLDVTKPEMFQRLIDETVSKHGRLDIIFNNAGIAITGDARDLKLEHWQKVVDVNLGGVINGTVMAYSQMVKQGFGQIVNTSSLAGLIGYPINSPYATSKFAVIGLSASMRAEGADLGVKVNVVCPGYVQTGIHAATPVINADHEKMMANIPSKKMDPVKAARLILRGVRKNNSMIIFPFSARLFWWLYRINQRLMAPLAEKLVMDFRALRIEPHN